MKKHIPHNNEEQDIFCFSSYQSTSKKLNVVKATFDSLESLYWEDIFNGYDHLYAITYSSSIPLMRQLFDKFEYIETIFGYPEVMGEKQLHLSSLQASVVKQITNDKNTQHLADLMEQGKLKFYVSLDEKSHEKIFLLSSREGRFRVVTGSANMSGAAFNGHQREIIVYMDGKEVFDTFMKQYESFREDSTNRIPLKTVKNVLDNPELLTEDVTNIPLIGELLSVKNTIVITESQDSNVTNDYAFAIDKKLFGDINWKKINELQEPPKSKDGNVQKIITSESINKVVQYTSRIRSDRQKKESITPSMNINFDSDIISICEKIFDLNPSKNEIKHDIDIIVEYFSWFEKCSGDVKSTIDSFWRFMNWYLAGPFIPFLRNKSIRYGLEVNLRYPVYGLLYGRSNCGKSAFLKFLTKLMTEQPACLLESEKFTKSIVFGMKTACCGLPINVDDIAKKQWSNNYELIKYDEWGVKEGLDKYPIVAMTSNSMSSFNTETKKRCITCRVDAALELEDSSEDHKFDDLLNGMTNAFYREYLRRMLQSVHEIARDIESGSKEVRNLLENSSIIIKDIFQEHTEHIPSFIRTLSVKKDYFGVKILSHSAIESLRLALQSEPSLFTASRKADLLVYTIPKGGNIWQLKSIEEELPKRWEAKTTQTTLTMKLSEARKVLNLSNIKGATSWIDKLLRN